MMDNSGYEAEFINVWLQFLSLLFMTLFLKLQLVDINQKWMTKNPAICGDTSFTHISNFGRFFKALKLPLMQHCITSNIALRPTLHYVQHWITCNIALRATLHYVQHCITCNIALCATLHYVQHCITCNIALRPTLHYVQHCIMCNIALRAKLHYV